MSEGEKEESTAPHEHAWTGWGLWWAISSTNENRSRVCQTCAMFEVDVRFIGAALGIYRPATESTGDRETLDR